EQDAEGYFLLEEPADLGQVAAYPDRDFRLTGPLDLTGIEQTQIGFSGTFDGGGHTITGYTSTDGGLFAVNNGTITRVGLAGATVESTAANVGLLVDTSHGEVSQVWT